MELPEETRGEVLERLTPLSRSMLAVTSKAFYALLNERIVNVVRLVNGAMNSGSVSILKMLHDGGCAFAQRFELDLLDIRALSVPFLRLLPTFSKSKTFASEGFLFDCIQLGRKDIIRCLVENKYHVRLSNSVLFRIALRGWVDELALLLEMEEDPSGYNIAISSAFRGGIRSGSLEVLDLLLEKMKKEKKEIDEAMFWKDMMELHSIGLYEYLLTRNIYHNANADRLEKLLTQSEAATAATPLFEAFKRWRRSIDGAISDEDWKLMTDSGMVARSGSGEKTSKKIAREEDIIEYFSRKVDVVTEQSSDEGYWALEDEPRKGEEGEEHLYRDSYFLNRDIQKFVENSFKTQNVYIREAVAAGSILRVKWLLEKGFVDLRYPTQKRQVLKEATGSGHIFMVTFFLDHPLFANELLKIANSAGDDAAGLVKNAIESHELRMAKMLSERLKVNPSSLYRNTPWMHDSTALRNWLGPYSDVGRDDDYY